MGHGDEEGTLVLVLVLREVPVLPILAYVQIKEGNRMHQPREENKSNICTASTSHLLLLHKSKLTDLFKKNQIFLVENNNICA
jgi:hypothetical protein